MPSNMPIDAEVQEEVRAAAIPKKRQASSKKAKRDPATNEDIAPALEETMMDPPVETTMDPLVETTMDPAEAATSEAIVPVAATKPSRKRKAQANVDGTPKAPRPPNAFMTFTAEKRASVQAELNTTNAVDVARRMGELWRALSPAEKAAYKPTPEPEVP